MVDDTNPAEIERFLLEMKVDVMAGGVKERVLAYKLGVGFVDHNHDRKELPGRIRRGGHVCTRGVYHHLHAGLAAHEIPVPREDLKMIPDTAKQVNENQCQQCMPLGGVIAFKGIENAMVLVHGSQGCSTYMRLASVEHYNEPVDIASSSLNEKQTIYGGEANLKKAIDNVVRVYQPKVLGVVTTCLAETMGEDLDRIIADYRTERGETGVDIIPVPTPSYSGSQTEGFWAATRAIIARYARPTEAHRRINVIIPHISPADIREIRRLLDLMGCEYTLIPDYSLTLDRPARREVPEDPARRDPDRGYRPDARRPAHDPVRRDLPGRTLARASGSKSSSGSRS